VNRSYPPPYHRRPANLDAPMPLRRSLTFALLMVVAVGCQQQRDGDTENPTARTALLADDDFVIEAVTADELLRQVAEVDSDLVVVNFWASWCAPCREEFPELMAYDRNHADVAVRFVSVDFEEDLEFAAEFLREQDVSGTTYLKTGRDQAFIDAISDRWTGSIPATAVYDRSGRKLTFWEGKVSYDELADRVDAVRTAS